MPVWGSEQNANEQGRLALAAWRHQLRQNIYDADLDFQHNVELYFPCREQLKQELSAYAEQVTTTLEAFVNENNLAQNLPRIEKYDGIGQVIETIVHHPAYEASGNLIYRSKLLEKMSHPGGLLEALLFFFLSSQIGEAGHHCPIACSAGIIRVLQKTSDFAQREFYLQKLTEPSYSTNFTGAQFLTEVQGGSDVGLNAAQAYQDAQGNWRIQGEKWFCSNANADLILMTARFDDHTPGTKGLGLFLVPAVLDSEQRNAYSLRRLKDKIGTKSMASAEIDFQGAFAIAVGKPEEGFKLVMENVLHISRLFNTFCVLGMGRRAYRIAYEYALQRKAFGQPIIHYPLVQEPLARIKVENLALFASICATTRLQDDFDLGKRSEAHDKLLLRLLANLNKYLSALWSVEHIHHAIDVLAGNGAIESFSILPRLLRDAIVCENWEGTHNTLRMQILKDLLRYQVDQVFLGHVSRLMEAYSPEEKYAQVFEERMRSIQNQVRSLKEASPELQTLLVKPLVDQMIYLYAAIQLYHEAHDQRQQHSDSKFFALDYFILLYLKEMPIAYDQEFLSLLKNVLRI